MIQLDRLEWIQVSLFAAGSCAAGLLYGAAGPKGPAGHRYPWCVAAMTALLQLPAPAAEVAPSFTPSEEFQQFITSIVRDALPADLSGQRCKLVLVVPGSDDVALSK